MVKANFSYLYSKILISVIFDLQGITVEQVINNMAHFFKKLLFWLFWYLFISSEVLNCTIHYEEAFSLLTFYKAGTFSICEIFFLSRSVFFILLAATCLKQSATSFSSSVQKENPLFPWMVEGNRIISSAVILWCHCGSPVKADYLWPR